jgi:hypothetical protein
MSVLHVRVFDADRKPLTGLVDVKVVDGRNEAVAEVRDARGGSVIKVDGLAAGTRHHVRVFPARHRPVGQLVVPAEGPPTNVHLFCPIDPDRARATFLPYDALPEALRHVLDRSTLEVDLTPRGPAVPMSVTGEATYASLTDLQKAGLLNLFCKMCATPVGSASAWHFVQDIYRARGDRIFANVAIDFRDHVKTAVAAGLFDEVSGALHDPGAGFTQAGSFKTGESFGNLQLTFFASRDTPLRFRIDADIDDANGVGHVFQVLRNKVKDRETHPFDIHQVLTFHHLLRPSYELAV